MYTGNIKIIDAETHKVYRAIIDKAETYRDGRVSMTKEECQHPDYAACTNEMRGLVEQYELLTDTPERISAYVASKGNNNGMGVARKLGEGFALTVWTGQQIGNATFGAKWRVGKFGDSVYQVYAIVNGREYTGRGGGPGMYVNLKETAKSKRMRK